MVMKKDKNIIYERKGYKIIRFVTPQTAGNCRIEYFIDDVSGKNQAVFRSLSAAKEWIYIAPAFTLIKKG